MLLHPKDGVVYASPAMEHVMGVDPDEFLGMFAAEWVHPDDVAEMIEQRRLAVHLGHSGPIEIRGRHGDGTFHWFEAEWWHIVFDHTVLHLRDVSERRAAREADARQDARLRAVLRDSNEIVVIVDPDGRRLRYASGSTERLLGWVAADQVDAHWPDLVHPDDLHRVTMEIDRVLTTLGASFTAEVRIRHRNDSWLMLEVRATNLIDDPLIGGIIVHAHDITRSYQLQRELAQQALVDGPTGLPNRILLLDRIDVALQRSADPSDQVALLCVGLDRFTSIIDTWGHDLADAVVREVGARLLHLGGRSDTVAAVTADEFAICLERSPGPAELAAFAQRVLDAINEPLLLDGQDLRLTARIGIAVAGAVAGNESTPDELLRDASAALHLAKSSGVQRVAWSDTTLRAAVRDRLELTDALRHAIADEEMVLHYQPTYDTRSGAIIAAEALVRWQHPRRGLLPPDQFIPQAEVSGAIVELGGWVLHTACQQAVQLGFHTFDVPLVMWVNVSARQLAAAGFIQQVTEALAAAQLPSVCLGLEITETVLLEAEAGFEDRISQLRRLGCHIAIDDFGTGYASLTYLRRYEIDVLKIDRSFVAGLENGGHDVSIVAAVNGLGLALDLTVTAEGVETMEQLDLLTQIGCPTVSGYALCRPIPGEQLATVLGQTLADRCAIFAAAAR